MASETLFLLIQSLSPPEKRYFDLFARQHFREKKVHPLRLFHYLCKLEVYDEKAVRDHWKGDSLGRQFAVYKNLLFKSVLRALQNYHYEGTASLSIRSALDKIELLESRGLAGSALKLTVKTRAMAVERGQTSYLPALLSLERKLQRTLSPFSLLEELPQLENETRFALHALSCELTAISLYDQLFAAVQVERRMEKKKSNKNIEEARKKLAGLKKIKNPGFSAMATMLSAEALDAQLRGDFHAMFMVYSRLVEWWERHPRICQDDPGRFARIQVAWLNSALASGNLGKYLPRVREMQAAPFPDQPEKARMIFQAFNLELLWWLSNDNAKKAVDFLPAFEGRLRELRPFIDDASLCVFFFNASEVNFRAEKYSASNVWINRLLQMEFTGKEVGFVRAARLLSIVVHCELGNFSVADSQLGSLARKIKNQDEDWEFGKLAAEWFRQILKHWGKASCNEIIRGFHRELSEIGAKKVPVPQALALLKMWAGRRLSHLHRFR